MRVRTGSAEVTGVDPRSRGPAPGARPWAPQDAGVPFEDDLQPPGPDPLAGERIATRWEGEANLPDESGKTFAQYEKALEDLTIEGRVKEVDCRQSACRVSLWFSSGEESLRFQTLAVADREGAEIRVDTVGEWPSLDGELNVELFVPAERD